MNDDQLIVDLHARQARQGPGGVDETRRALARAGLDRSRPLAVADLGCGTGASALVLADELQADVLALDRAPEFIRRLDRRARVARCRGRIQPVVGCLAALPFHEAALDVIWSEGAIYSVGFRRGLSEWRRVLKPGGVIAVSELIWTTSGRPAEIDAYWKAEYAEIDTLDHKLRVMGECGYEPISSFVLPALCWSRNYYRPLQDQFHAFLARHPDNPRARALVEADRREIEMYERFGDCFSYGFMIARRN